MQEPIKVLTRITFYSAHRTTPRDAPEDFTVPPGKRQNILRRSFYKNPFLQKRSYPVTPYLAHKFGRHVDQSAST